MFFSMTMRQIDIVEQGSINKPPPQLLSIIMTCLRGFVPTFFLPTYSTNCDDNAEIFLPAG